MKRLLYLTTSILFFTLTAQAKIWRVNNMPGVTADFTTAQAAHNGAANGDTIHLEPSVTNYGAVTCTKTLVWLSIGNFLTQNPGNQHSSIPGILSTMNMNAGSQGSVISVVTDAGININVPNVVVKRTYMGGALSITGVSTLVSQCFITQYVFIGSTDAIITNNIIGAGLTVNSNSFSAIITNNVLNYIARNEIIFGPSTIYNSVFQNNISVKGGNIFFSNSQQSYNMCSDASFPAGNNNQLNVNMTNVFVNSTGTVDKDYILKAGSAALAAGYGGTDLGAFGGSSPFKLALQPAIPAVTALSSPSSSGSNTIQVTFSAKSNN